MRHSTGNTKTKHRPVVVTAVVILVPILIGGVWLAYRHVSDTAYVSECEQLADEAFDAYSSAEQSKEQLLNTDGDEAAELAVEDLPTAVILDCSTDTSQEELDTVRESLEAWEDYISRAQTVLDTDE